MSVIETNDINKAEEQLNRIKEHAIQETEFYHSFSPTDRFPVLDKSEIMEYYDAHKAHEGFENPIHISSTSGSTGTPFSVSQDHMKRLRTIADLKVFGDYADYPSHERMVYFRAMNEHSNKRSAALIAYPSTLDTAVNFWMKKFPVNQSYIRSIISTSETLTTETREKLVTYFGQNCGIYARYSNTENGILGQETGTEGTYLLNWASYHFEILKLDSDEPVEEGELGRIIVTDLYNKAFPMIRYDTGDVAKMVYPEKGFPYFTELLGRRMDLIYDTNNEVVSPFLLCRTMRLSKGIEQWQFIQETETEYVLKITVTKDEKKPKCEKEIAGFQQVLGEKAKIIIEYVDDIPVMNSLKRKLIVSYLDK